MNRQAFFDAIRSSVFGGRLPQTTVDGVEALLRANERYGGLPIQHLANVLAQVHHETDGYMLPIKETVYASHKDKNPSDATVIQRLNNAFAKGQLPWVKTPYWRDGAFGRGQVQLTHWSNYEKFAKRLGIPLRQNPGLALDPDHGADIALIGMAEGLFTGKKLGDFNFPSALDAKPASNPRRIVNGQDGTDEDIAKVHRKFLAALQAAGYGDTLAVKPQPAPKPTEPVAPERNWGDIAADLRRLADEIEQRGKRS